MYCFLTSVMNSAYMQQNIFLTKLDNCYSEASFASINKILRKIIVQLDISNTSECNYISNSVGINITLGNSIIPITLQTLYYNFSYFESDLIIIDIPTDISGVPIDLTNYYEESFVIIHIFSYSHLIEIELMVFDEIRSDLENCFNELTINLYPQYFQFVVSPQLSCIDQITAQSSQLDTTYVQSIQLSVGTQQFFLDVNTFVSNYQAQVNFTEIITPDQLQ
ncbi:Conserved_hypothetical protein [Hexamita inflata]|uniref:Transmembrane protein n=1 Tax=Hexamita inflata TaxID=28002 RepID=A0ABP1HNB7_9EUKA